MTLELIMVRSNSAYYGTKVSTMLLKFGKGGSYRGPQLYHGRTTNDYYCDTGEKCNYATSG